jgi:hypothetical protein
VLQTLAIIALSVFALPVVVFFTVKLGTFAYYSGRARYREYARNRKKKGQSNGSKQA